MISSDNQTQHLSLSFGFGVRLMPETWYLQEVFHNSITKTAFRSLCRALKVPMMEIGNTRWVDTHRMELAMTAILRIGEKDFFAPGSQTLRHHASSRKTSYNTELDLEAFRKDFRQILAELLAAKVCNGKKLTSDVKKAARLAADRLTRMGLQYLPTMTQALRTNAALKEYSEEVRDGLGSEWKQDSEEEVPTSPAEPSS